MECDFIFDTFTPAGEAADMYYWAGPGDLSVILYDEHLGVPAVQWSTNVSGDIAVSGGIEGDLGNNDSAVLLEFPDDLWADLPEGVFLATVTVYDAAGNSARLSVNITKDTLAPGVCIPEPVNNSIIDEATMPIIIDVDEAHLAEAAIVINETGYTVHLSPSNFTRLDNGTLRAAVYLPAEAFGSDLRLHFTALITVKDAAGNVSRVRLYILHTPHTDMGYTDLVLIILGTLGVGMITGKYIGKKERAARKGR